MADELEPNINNEDIAIQSGSEDDEQQTTELLLDTTNDSNEAELHKDDIDTNEMQIDETNEPQLPIADTSAEVLPPQENEAHDDIAIDNELKTADIEVIIEFEISEISERKSDTEHDTIAIHEAAVEEGNDADDDDDDDHIDSNTPLKEQDDANSMVLDEEEERDLFSSENPVSAKMYNEYMRRRSVSTSDIPHSLQVLTPQHIDRPKDDALAQISEMGFDRALSEKAYDVLLNDNNGDHGAFTTEQVIELMLSQDLDLYQSDVELNIARRKEEEEKVEIVVGATQKGSGESIECPICRVDQLISDIHSTSCGHNYCKKCLSTHYKTSIENGVVSFVCMEEECERSIAQQELFLFIEDEVYRSKYYKFLRNVRLAKDPTIRWCVKAGCDTPIKRKSRKQRKLECTKCHTIVCYECAGLYYNNNQDANKSKQAHNCNKNLDEKLTNWAKTKNYDVEFCPRCAARIEKLSGCNHMRCTYCKYEFCWLCRKEFKKGHYDPSNIVFGCPGAENATKRPDKCAACCVLFKSCMLMCCLPFRICCWRMSEQGAPWCLCWCCCND